MLYSVKYLQSHFEEIKGSVTINGWVRTNRNQKEFGFISFNDGTTLSCVQIVYDKELSNFDAVSKFRVGSALRVSGNIVLTPNTKQPYEIHATEIILEGDCPEDYPIQPKRHTKEFLREQAYLRPRTNLFNATFRLRSVIAYAIHKFFQEREFVYVHTPIITASDAEGAGQMFKVTTLDLENLPKTEDGKIDYSKDFFAKHVNLTVSGQLEAETFAQAFKNVYTFGPTFRAENSNTVKHAAEFWMIEPEIAFCDLNEDMNVIEAMIKYVVEYALLNCPEEMQFFDTYVCPGKIDQLKQFLSSNIVRLDYKDAIELFKKSGHNFEVNISYGDDLTSEHEKYLTDTYFKAPVFVTNWPKEIKSFYMRLNDDQKTVAAVDLLVPGSGELVGGSQREERLDILEQRMDELGVPKDSMYWYLNLRKYGGTKHSGFGVGFERLVMYVSGIDNIRDTIPYPRTPRNCEF